MFDTLPPGHELSTLLGEIADVWSLVEDRSFCVFRTLLQFGRSQPYSRRTKLPPEQFLREYQNSIRIPAEECHAIYYSMRSFKDQLDMIANLADAVFTGHLLASKTASIVERVKKLSEVRNRIIHGRWIYLHNVSSDGATVTTILRVMRTASEMDTFVAVAGGWPSDDRARLRQSIRDKKIFNKKKLLEHKEQFREMCAHLARLNDEIIGRA